MPEINGARLLADLRRLAEFGAYKSGVHRPTFSPQDIEARGWLAGRFTDAGLEASIDGIGNVFGRSRATGPKLLLGSHTESQNHAGWLDGALGVMYGLEVARAFREDPGTADVAIDVASWADEEGHFGSFLGSRSFIGDVTDEEIDKARDHNDGTPQRWRPQALRRASARQSRLRITSAISKRTSSRATSSMKPDCVSALSPESLASANIASSSPERPIMRARHAWVTARTRASRSSNCPRRSRTVFLGSRDLAASGPPARSISSRANRASFPGAPR
jgi:Peptidase family M28